MKQQKYLVQLCLAIIVLFNACGKTKTTPSITHKIHGYIYNKNDSSVFKNTQFKLYFHSFANGVNSDTVIEEFFTTDVNGYFNYTTKMTSFLITWPSYSYGAIYTGPPYLGNGVSQTYDKESNTYTTDYGNLYTTPYH